MSNELIPQKIHISDFIKQELNNQVSEIIAVEEKPNLQEKRSFTVYEMWSRQRNSRSATEMMRRWSLN